MYRSKGFPGRLYALLAMLMVSMGCSSSPTCPASHASTHPSASTPWLFVFGPDRPGQVIGEQAETVWGQRIGRNHSLAGYREVFDRKTRAGDTLVLLLSLDNAGRVPDEFKDILPEPWPDIEARIKNGQDVFLKGHARDMNIILFASPTVNGLENLIRQSDWLPSSKPKKPATQQ
jgi:hypothetical protein